VLAVVELASDCIPVLRGWTENALDAAILVPQGDPCAIPGSAHDHGPQLGNDLSAVAHVANIKS